MRRRGQWDHGHRHGFGELVDHSAGTTFSGEWRYDRKHGRGEEVYADGSRYVGLWANGQRHGPGRLHLAEGGSAARDYAHGSPITRTMLRLGPKFVCVALICECFVIGLLLQCKARVRWARAAPWSRGWPKPRKSWPE